MKFFFLSAQGGKIDFEGLNNEKLWKNNFSAPFGGSKKRPKTVFQAPLLKHVSESEVQRTFEGVWEALKEVFRAEMVKRLIQVPIDIWTILNFDLDAMVEWWLFVKCRNLQRRLKVLVVNVSLIRN